MSLMFLNPFDPSGLGLYSRTAKNMVERMPVLAKQRRHSVKPKTRYATQEQENAGGNQIIQSATIANNTPLPAKKRNLRASQPFAKSLSRQQRIMGLQGKNRNPAVGAYHPKQSLKQPKMVWNILGAYQRSVNHRKQVQERKERAANSIVLVKARKKKQQNPQTEPIETIATQHHEQLLKNLSVPEQVHYDRFLYKKSAPFVDMKRMLGRQSTTTLRQQSCYQTAQLDEAHTFLTTQIRPLSSKKGTIQFNKQLSREKVQSLHKQNSNLVYDCNYTLVTTNNKIGPDFTKMVNRNGKSIQTQLSEQEHPDYSQIWLNRAKSSLPNLQLVLQRKIRKERSKRFKTEQENVE